MEYLKKLTPADYVSLLCLVFAWLAIVLVINNQPNWAIVINCMAILIDTVDGYVARRLKVDSDLGRHLDSAIDIVNYVFFSGLMAYRFLFTNTNLGFIVSLLILIFGVLRLVRLNVTGILTEGNHKYYEGIVTTHISLLVILLYLIKPLLPFATDIIFAVILLPLILLMISKIKTIKPTNYFVLYAVLIIYSVWAIYREFFNHF